MILTRPVFLLTTCIALLAMAVIGVQVYLVAPLFQTDIVVSVSTRRQDEASASIYAIDFGRNLFTYITSESIYENVHVFLSPDDSQIAYWSDANRLNIINRFGWQ